jgi:hypothetical protein
MEAECPACGLVGVERHRVGLKTAFDGNPFSRTRCLPGIFKAFRLGQDGEVWSVVHLYPSPIRVSRFAVPFRRNPNPSPAAAGT